jgi:hypothetical protein
MREKEWDGTEAVPPIKINGFLGSARLSVFQNRNRTGFLLLNL